MRRVAWLPRPAGKIAPPTAVTGRGCYVRIAAAVLASVAASGLSSAGVLAVEGDLAPDPAAPASGAAQSSGGIFERDRLTGDWGGVRRRWEDAGVIFGGNYIADSLTNPVGGVRGKTIYEGRAEVSAGLDLDKLVGWSGAVFRANAYQIHGRGLSATGVGNLLTVSNIEAQPATRLFGLWLQQNLLDQSISIRAGKIAADDEFFLSQYGATFVNATFGWPAIMGSNLPSGGLAYPLAAPGLRIRGAPSLGWTVSAAAFNGDPAPPGPGDPQLRNASGIDFRVGRSVFAITEAAYAFDVDSESSATLSAIKLGAWYHSGHFPDQRVDTLGLSLADPLSSGIAATRRGDVGFYLVADKMLWRRPGTADQGLAGFLRLGGAPADRNLIGYYVDGGVTYRGILAGRESDSAGVAVAFAAISGDARRLDRDAVALTGMARPLRDFEAVIEVTYQAQLAPWWFVQPDLQVVLHPGGHVANPAVVAGTKAIPDAIIVGLRTSLTF